MTVSLSNRKFSDVEFDLRQSRHATCHGSQRDERRWTKEAGCLCGDNFSTKKFVVLVFGVLASQSRDCRVLRFLSGVMES